MSRRVRIIGAGRAGGSFAIALAAAGWSVQGPLGRNDDLANAAQDTDLVLLCVPDAAIESVSAEIVQSTTAVVAHVSGSLGLEVLAPHERVGSLHPVMSLPTPQIGAQRLCGGWFAVAGDPMLGEVADALDGRTFVVGDADRAVHHAAACVAANHVVALLGQVERMAESIGAPLDAYLKMANDAVANVAALGARAALTGPAARGDDETIRRHLRAIDPSERATYEVMVAEARRLAGRVAAEPIEADGRSEGAR